MKRALLSSAALALALIAVAITVLAQPSPAPASPAQAGARVRFVHASPDVSAVDVLLDGSTVFTNVAFSRWTEYMEVATGTYTVSARLTSEGTPVLTDTVMMTDTDYTLTAAGTKAAGGKPLELITFLDDNSAPPGGMARGRFVHLVPDAPPVDIALEGEILFESVGYGDATDYVAVPSGSHTLQIQTPLGEITATATAGPNDVYSFFAVGRVFGSPALDIVQTLDETYNHPIWLPLVTKED